MMKRAMLMMMLLTGWLWTGSVQAQYDYSTNADNTITISLYHGPAVDVTIPDRITGLPVTGIGASAFSGCPLTIVRIGTNVTTIGEKAFAFCYGMQAIMVDALNTAYRSVDGVLFNKSQTILIQCPGGWFGSYVIPTGVVTIGNAAFGACYDLTDITIPPSVTDIGYDAFLSCGSLTNITLGTGVTSIGSGAFFYCTSLTSIAIPDSVTSIGYWTLAYCSSLTNATLGRSVTNIGGSAFFDCTGLTGITIPNKVTNIGDNAFFNCADLTGVYFKGNAPSGSSDSSIFSGATNTTVYYLPGTTGWDATYGGRPTVCWNPTAQYLGEDGTGFGFDITGSSNLVIVVEACTNLAEGDWAPLSTNTLTGGSSTFTDPQSANYPARFYRFRPGP